MPILAADLREILANGENSGVEFKRDGASPESLAKELAAFANLEGGTIFLGVEDDGAVSGLNRSIQEVEEWVMNLCRQNLQPAVIPYWETVRLPDGRIVGVIGLPADMPDKPYKARRSDAWVTFVRVGSTSREASREEEGRLYQSGGTHRYEIRPVSGATLDDLDLRRLRDYFFRVRGQEWPAHPDEQRTLLTNTEILVESNGHHPPTVAGMLLFGKHLRKYCPQAAIDAEAYPGAEREYASNERVALVGPLTGLYDESGKLVETGQIEEAMNFVNRHLRRSSEINPSTGQREDRAELPTEAVREAIVNAVVHRDYAITTVTNRLSMFADRLEVTSPGRLTNTVTIAKMFAGYRATRNEVIKEVLRDYRYVEASGLGIPRKIVKGMRAFNGTDPILAETEDAFSVTLLKAAI